MTLTLSHIHIVDDNRFFASLNVKATYLQHSHHIISKIITQIKRDINLNELL